MKLDLRHAFDCEPEMLWRLTDSEEFERRLADASNADRELIEGSDENGEEYRRRRITVRRELPAAMRRVIGTEAIQYDQETWRRDGSNELRWKITPKVLEGRFSGEGVTRIEPIGDGRCERIIQGDLTIRVPLIGKRIEQKLVDDVSASYTRAAEILRDMLKEQ